MFWQSLMAVNAPLEVMRGLSAALSYLLGAPTGDEGYSSVDSKVKCLVNGGSADIGSWMSNRMSRSGATKGDLCT